MSSLRRVTLSFCAKVLEFGSSCDIKHPIISLTCDNRSTLRNNHHIVISLITNYHSNYLPALVHLQSLASTPPQSQTQWRLATRVHGQAITAAHIPTAATTTKETHATPDHPAATAAPPTTALLTLLAAAVEAAATTQTPTEPPSATPDPLAHAHPPAPPITTTPLHANALLPAHLVVQMPIYVSSSANQHKTRLLQQ
jgi:hypothetical protein